MHFVYHNPTLHDCFLGVCVHIAKLWIGLKKVFAVRKSQRLNGKMKRWPKLSSSKFQAVSLTIQDFKLCLNQWVLQAAWSQYRQEYGTRAYEGPEHKSKRHVAYRQMVRWCWGVLGKDIRVPLPSCAVSCIRAHFPPPGLEEDFEFDGFKFADE